MAQNFNFNLTQTGEEVQDLLNQVTPNTEDIAELKQGEAQRPTTQEVQQIVSTALAPYSTTTQMQTTITQAVTAALADYSTTAEMDSAISAAITAALAPYSTTAQMNTAITQAITTALAQYYTKSEIDAKTTALNSAIGTETTRAQSVESNLQQLIVQVSAQLVNYYLKSETYSRSEVQQLVDNVRQFQYKVVATLPQPTADTVGWIYLVPGSHTETQNVKEEYITILEGSSYKWEHIGSTNVDLSGYSTTEEMNAAIASALASYYTKAQVDAMVQTINTAIAQKQDTISDLAAIRSGASAGATALQPAALTPYSTTEQMNAAIKAESDRAKAAEDANAQNITTLDGLVEFINKSLGKYDGETVKTLSQAKAGKYVNVDGSETTASGYGISAPITLNAGDILLVPSAQAVPASVSVVARLVDRTYQKVIAYIYTYREDYPELPATATADYDATLVYTAVYDDSGDTPTLTGWTRAGQTYTTLPATREVSEQFYEPLMKQAVSAMPSTGYYIYLSPTAMTVVVSGLTATVSGGTALVVGWGIFKNITTNFVGAPGQSVLAQAFAVLFAAIDGLKAQLDNLGETKAKSIDFEEQPKLCGQPLVIEGDGAPAAPVVPTMVGQRYHDNTNRKVYEAFSVTNSVSDWVLLN